MSIIALTENQQSQVVSVLSAMIAAGKVNLDNMKEAAASIAATLFETEVAEQAPTKNKEPAVSVAKSITPDYIVCLEDGKKLKMLRRHLRTVYNMSPEEYRAKWGLPADYPMVAPNYSQRRSDLAVQIGLGRKTKEEQPAPVVERGVRAA